MTRSDYVKIISKHLRRNKKDIGGVVLLNLLFIVTVPKGIERLTSDTTSIDKRLGFYVFIALVLVTMSALVMLLGHRWKSRVK